MSLLNKASLIQIPSGYKDGTLYSAKPTNGDGDFTFSRGSNLAATRVNSEGLIEKGRENLLLQSNSFDTTWANSSTSETSGQTGYDGSSNAWLLTKTASSGYIYQNVSNGGILTFSIYAKAGTLDWIRFVLNGSLNAYQYFDLNNGVLGSGADGKISSSITNVGNGWYRCSLAVNNGTIARIRIYPADDDNDTSGTSGSIIIQDAQLEQGLVSTDVITTTTTTAQAGILEDMPRLDYSGGASCPSLLLEPQRVNHLTQSEYYSGGTWIKQSGTTVTQNTTDTLSPEGKYNASKVTSNGSNGLFHTLVYTAGGANTKSIYLKGVSGGEVVYLKDPYQTVSTTTCTLTTEWQRFTLSETQTSSASLWIDDIPSGGIYMWGAMLEAGSYSTSLIPTYGSSVTRSEDVCVNGGNSSTFNDSEGVFFFQGSTLVEAGETRVISISDGSTSNNIYMNFNNNANSFNCEIIASSSTQFNPSVTMTKVNNNKIAIKYKENDFALWINGVEVATDTSGSTPTGLDRFNFDFGQGSFDFKGNVKQTLYFNTALSDTELADLTTL